MRRRFMASQEVKEIFDYNNYLTIEALEDDFSVTFTNEVEYGIDGVGWSKLEIGSSTPTIGMGHTISFRGYLTPHERKGVGRFIMNKPCNLLGNVMSILFGYEANNIDSLNGYDYAFYELFLNCTGIKSISANFLPATTLASYCYGNMFYYCTGLTQAPELPATTLADNCYSYMFLRCTGLTQAPELPATTLASFCYRNMFYYCTGLTQAPELPATTLADNCYRNMFYGCTNLNYIKMLATDISALDCLTGWVVGVASTGTFVKHPDMNSLPIGANGIPEGWTVVNDGEESGGNKVVNRITVKSFESGPDEYGWYFSIEHGANADVTVSAPVYKDSVRLVKGSETLAMVQKPKVAEISDFTIDPIEDDYYIYELVVE